MSLNTVKYQGPAWPHWDNHSHYNFQHEQDKNEAKQYICQSSNDVQWTHLTHSGHLKGWDIFDMSLWHT